MKYTHYILIAALLLAGCEKQIEIDADDQEQKVVVMAQNTADSPVTLTLTYSRPTFGYYYVADGESRFPAITDATATLAVGGGTPLAAMRDGNRYTFVYAPQPGDSLTLSVSVPDKQAVTATATVPQRPAVSDVTAVYDNPNAPSITASTISFTLTDNAATADYYAIRLHSTDTLYYTYFDENYDTVGHDTIYGSGYVDFSCTDYLLINSTNAEDYIDPEDPNAGSTYWGDDLYITDDTWNGQSHRIKLQPKRYWNTYDDNPNVYNYYDYCVDVGGSSYTLEISAISKDLYLYLQSVDSYDDDAILGLLSEPVQIHCNIDGGIGIFGFRTQTTVPVPTTSGK